MSERSERTDAAPAASRPVLRVVRGEPTAEEIAVLAALVSASGDAADEPPVPSYRGRWNDPANGVGLRMRHGPGAWRASLR